MITLSRHALFAASASLLLGLSTRVSAQTPALDALQRQGNRILQEDIQRQRERQQELQAPSRQPPPEQPAPAGLPIPVPAGGCVNVSRIELRGAQVISTETLDGEVAGQQGRCLTVPELEGLLRRLTNLYVDRGYVTSRVYLPAQDMAGGRLVLVVVEGRVEGIELNQPGVAARHEVKTGFPGQTGEVLDLRRLEQGLDQLNRLASNNARLRLEPGREAGGTQVFIDNTPGPRWRGSAGVDNAGFRSTSTYQGVLGAEADNLLGLNDFWSLSLRRSLAGDSGHRNLFSYAADVSIPYGRWTLRLSANEFTWRSTTTTPTQRFGLTGLSSMQSVTLDYMLYRDDVSKTSAHVSLSHRRTRNYVEDVRLNVSSPTLLNATFGVTHDRRLLGGVFGVSVQHVRGLAMLDATHDARRADSSVPEAQFEKWTMSVSYSHALGPAEKGLSWRLFGFGQWSQDPLYGAEQLALGGLYTVRGFKDETASGRTGFYLRNEVSWRLPLPATAPFTWLGQVSAYAGHDYGVLRRQSPLAPLERGMLQGVALGLRASGGTVGFDVSVAWPLAAPAFIRDRGPQVYAALVVRF
jgi:hemolysin activation/secretion protein